MIDCKEYVQFLGKNMFCSFKVHEDNLQETVKKLDLTIEGLNEKLVMIEKFQKVFQFNGITLQDPTSSESLPR